MFEAVIHDPLDGSAHGVSRGFEAGSRFIPTQTLGPAGEKMMEYVAARSACLTPKGRFLLRWQERQLTPLMVLSNTTGIL